jgi:hypothetical protein
MRQAGIGRVLVASLHQGIADLLPTRLAFYENWLNAEGLRGGTIGLAPVYAVLSFLRQEGTCIRRSPAAPVSTQPSGLSHRCRPCSAGSSRRRRHGCGAAGWCVWRDKLVRSSYHGSRAVSRVRKGTVNVDLRASIFCSVREPVPQPLCGFYAAAFTRLLALFDLHAHVEVVACRGTGEPTCVVRIALTDASDLSRPEAA